MQMNNYKNLLFRFSNNPIRMTGRVLSTVRGEVIGSSRFIMVLSRDGHKK